ncbi:MAG: SPOR domain-containing protein [Candidatus Omnitrophota bacterium]|nr:MAG: SPOR domain-containing protein [Candidatus Omnitrophota bacterium]
MRGRQLHLFGVEEDKKLSRGRRPIALPLDTIILLCIVIGLLLTVAFSLGVERGRKIASLDRVTISQESMPVEVKEETPPTQTIQPAQEKNESVGSQEKETPEKEKYIIQVASYIKENRAHQEAKNLENKGYPVVVSKKGKYIVIFVGEFGNKSEAKENMKALKKRYNDCFLRIVKK